MISIGQLDNKYDVYVNDTTDGDFLEIYSLETEELIHSEIFELMYEPRWGIDVEDMARVQSRAVEIIDAL